MVACSIGHIFVLLFDVLAWLHEFGHLVAVEDLLLVFGAPVALGILGAPLDVVLHFVLHLLFDLVLAGLAVGVGLDFAELLEEVVVAAQVLEEVFVLRALHFSQIKEVHAIICTKIISTRDARSLISYNRTP